MVLRSRRGFVAIDDDLYPATDVTVSDGVVTARCPAPGGLAGVHIVQVLDESGEVLATAIVDLVKPFWPGQMMRVTIGGARGPASDEM